MGREKGRVSAPGLSSKTQTLLSFIVLIVLFNFVFLNLLVTKYKDFENIIRLLDHMHIFGVQVTFKNDQMMTEGV